MKRRGRSRGGASSPLDEARAQRLREERDLEAELEAHLAHRVDDLMAGGVGPEEALTRARAELGDAERVMAESRQVRDEARRRASRRPALEALRQDLAHTLRQLRRAPGFALTVLVTLTLGVGSATTITSVVDAVVLEPLPFEDPDRVVFAEMVTPSGDPFSVDEPTFLDWQALTRSFDAMAALTLRNHTRRDEGEPRLVDVMYVSHRLLDVLGLEPVIGRMFSADEDRSGAEAHVALLSRDAWTSEHARDPSVLGTRIDLDGETYEVIGVMPEALDVLTGATPVFVPMGPDPDMDRTDHYLDVVARLAADVTFAGARSELVEVQRRIAQTYPADRGWSATILPSRDVLIGDTTELAGWILLAASGLFLLMACVNASNLLVVRATTRRAEMGLRAALGASRWRLVRQILTESAFLAVVGGAAGVLLAYTALPVVEAMGEGRVPRLDQASLDRTAILACLVSVALATLMCAAAPVVQVRGGALARAMAGRRGSSDPGSAFRSTLVGAQVSMTVVLLVGTGLLFRSFLALSSVDPGFEPEGTLAVRIGMPDGAYTWEGRAELFPRIREAVEGLPGVTAAGASMVDPFSGWNLANFVARADRMPDRAADFTPIGWRAVTPGFFEAMGMDLRAGRAFVESDDWGEQAPVVIGESLADVLWGAEDPIGQTLVWGDPSGSRLRVVGVVEDLRDVTLGDVPTPIVYRPYRQIPWPAMTLVARVQGPSSATAALIRARIREIVPSVPVPEIRSLEQNLRLAVAEPRFHLRLLSSFAAVGLLLAVVGIYGLTEFDVRRRFREIGIRMSLGADPRGVRAMILRQRLRLTVLGLASGLALSWVLVRWIESQLYGVTARDPVTWLGVVLLVPAAAAAAAYLPARRATRVDPREVLSVE
jgi:predicted permease